MHVFISAGEPSGEMHGANLIPFLQALDPNVRVSGFGGDKMKAAGCELLYPLTNHSVMWVWQVFKRLRHFRELLDQAQEFFRKEKPDVVVVIDYPGFHWKLAERAKQEGIPVVYFVPPQIWAWAQWRVKKMKRLMTLVMSSLPFEHEWFIKKGVNAVYIGHPYFDDLAKQKLDEAFLAEQKHKPGRVIGILPGSRNQEVTRNIPEMLRAARRIHVAEPTTRFLVAAFNEHQAEMARQEVAKWQMAAEVFVGRTPEIIELSEACIAVSGSVSLEMMYRRKPAVIVYRIKRLDLRVARKFMKVEHITLVNFLAEEKLYPEFLTDRDPSEKISRIVSGWLRNPQETDRIRQRLGEICATHAKPGACEKAAKLIQGIAEKKQGKE